MIGDSIIKHIAKQGKGSIKDTELSINRGKGFKTIVEIIVKGDIKLHGWEVILLHLGTNDVADLFRINKEREKELIYFGYTNRVLLTPLDIFNSFVALINIIRQRNARAKIIFSAILPRPCDHDQSNSVCHQVNARIKEYCLKTQGMIFNPTFTWFQKHGKPVISLFGHYDQLHLSFTGKEVLTQAFQMALADSNIAAESHCRRPGSRRQRVKKH